ncbi:MAG: PTS system mannose/fructose/sorbose family transporter subunit IID [Elusimicrobiota bacterium]
MDKDMQAAVFSRSLLLQAGWSYEGMQNLGFVMALDPWLRRLYREPEEYRRAVRRHLGYFNTHPYMVGIVLGAVGKLEERRCETAEESRDELDRRIDQMKKSLSAALAAVGDSFFWGALRPACAAWTVLLWLVLWTYRVPHAAFWSAVFYLTVFNTPALWARWRGIRLGYGEPEGIVAKLEGLRWQRKARWLRRAGLLAVALILAASWLVPPWGGAVSWVGAGVFGAALWLRTMGATGVTIYAGAVVLGCLAALAGL